MAKIDQVLVNGTTYEIVPEIAPLFSENTAYAVGDCVIKDAVLYRFTTAHAAGAWIGTDAEEVTVGNELTSLKADFNNFNELDGYLKYFGSDFSYNGSSNWPAINRKNGTNITISGTFATTKTDYVLKMSGDWNISVSADTINGWPKELSLSSDKKYRLTVKLLSGTFNIPSGMKVRAVITNSANAKYVDLPIIGSNAEVDFFGNDDTNLFLLTFNKTESFTDAVFSVTIREVEDEVHSEVERIFREESVNVYSIYSADYLVGKGYSGSTSSIVDAVNNVISGYVKIGKEDFIKVSVNGKSIFNTPIDGQIRKVALYDSNKTWLKTIKFSETELFNNPYVCFNIDGYIRVMLRKTDLYPEVLTTSIRKDKEVDLLLFAGQSNMAGRGVTSVTYPETAPEVIPNAGYEFKAITDPTKLYPLTEPFGVAENNENGIDDGNKKTGSMVSAFVNAYYTYNGNVPAVCVSASEGGTSSRSWLPNAEDGLFADMQARFASARQFLVDGGYSIRKQYCVWCQGESDGDDIAAGRETLDQYESNINAIIDGLLTFGLDKIMLVRIGNCNKSGNYSRYTNIIEYQTELAQDNENFVMVSCDFAGMQADGLMKDNFHYYQKGYNITGNHAGINAAIYATSGKEPTMYDTEYNNLYYSHNN